MFAFVPDVSVVPDAVSVELPFAVVQSYKLRSCCCFLISPAILIPMRILPTAQFFLCSCQMYNPQLNVTSTDVNVHCSVRVN